MENFQFQEWKTFNTEFTEVQSSANKDEESGIVIFFRAFIARARQI